MNYHTPKLLAGRGFTYDSSLMDSDHPYVLATDEEPGVATLVEVPVSSGLDDGEQYAFLPSLIGSGVIESPAKAERMKALPGLWITTAGDLAAHVGSLGQAPRTCPRPIHPADSGADAYWVGPASLSVLTARKDSDG